MHTAFSDAFLLALDTGTGASPSRPVEKAKALRRDEDMARRVAEAKVAQSDANRAEFRAKKEAERTQERFRRNPARTRARGI
jgi:hypothetical protein